MFNPKLFWTSISLESIAYTLLLANVSDLERFTGYFTFHFGASLCVAICVWPFLPAQYRQPKLGVIAFLTTFSFFIPALAFIALLLLAVSSHFLALRYRPRPFVKIALPEFVGGAAGIQSNYSIAGVWQRLAQPQVLTATRMKSLLAMQYMPAKLISPLLRQLLADKTDDIRLIAYGMLDGREKQINQRIHTLSQQLKETDEHSLQLFCLKQLVELHWELFYQGLVQGEVAKYTQSRTADYIRETLKLNPDDPDMWIMLGKVHLSQDQIPEAEAALERACTLKCESRALPYLAELQFRQGNYNEVRHLLFQIPAAEYNATLHSLLDFWFPRHYST